MAKKGGVRPNPLEPPLCTGLSYGNEEHLLDVPFTSKEVFMAVSKLKKKKSPGSDSLLAEHLKAGDNAVVI